MTYPFDAANAERLTYFMENLRFGRSEVHRLVRWILDNPAISSLVNEPDSDSENKKMADDYKPVACDIYEAMESFAVKHQTCRIKFTNEQNTIETQGCRIVDVFSKDGEEFIRLDDDRAIRLDHIIATEII